ncbi:MAG: penicillin-binding transpeptidase domain-containing protein [Chloroflexota bacterium]|nr:penicillin-binding transpeptidase domain-containing protein [Chloroflexota bacterium]
MTNRKSQFSNLTSAVLALFLLAGCSVSPTTTPITPPPTHPHTPTPPAPTATPLPPSPDVTAAAFLNAWGMDDYATMYALLSPPSQLAFDVAGFTERYHDALTTATVLTVTTRLQSALQDGEQAYVSFQLTLDTALVGTLITDTVMSLSLHAGQWMVDWDEGLIWPQLAGGHYFRMVYSTPARANIYDRAGLGLATTGKIVTIGIIPGQIEDEDILLTTLAAVTGLSPDEIRGRYVAAPADWKIPIADIPAEVSVDHNDALSSTPGIYRDEKEGRTYSHFEESGAAPHVIGWVSPVPAEKLGDYRAQGYRGDEWVGVSGLEAWGEEILAGRHGGVLTVITPEGEKIATVAERSATPSRPIHTTFDRDFQTQVQRILGGRKGAIVVLDVHTGAVRALASGPGFDPNVFIGPAGEVGRSQILADPRRPLFNRATQGTYPLGSVFKIITIAAAMEEAGMTPDQTFFYCPGYWEGLGPTSRKDCWKEDGHGDISLKDGLTASCNVVFYAAGQTLDGVGQDVLPGFGQGFGFGVPTGLEGVLEEDGLMPDPAWKANTLDENWWVGDTVNLAIGQGNLNVTPLQVARMMAAVANGGTLYQTYIVERIGAAGEAATEQIPQPQVVGTLPVTPEHLAVIRDALLGVTTKPIGTATRRFAGLHIPVAGKTGTAEAGGPDTEPHSWFAAYAPADNPEIAIAAIVENAGEGSTVAAPLVRQVIEAYYGLPLSPLPPQAEEGYVPPTPTPQP